MINILTRVLILFCSLSVTSVLFASPYPDSGTIFREFKDGGFRQYQPIEKTKEKKLKKEPVATGEEVFVTGYEVHGNTQLTKEKIQAVLEPFTNRKSFDTQLTQASDALASAYHQAGIFSAKVFIPPQQIRNGLVKLQVFEGHFDKTAFHLVNPGKRVSDDVLLSVLQENLKPGEIIRTNDIEKSILLIEDMPGIYSKVTLFPGVETGTANFHIETVDESLISGNIDIDNFGGYYTGEYRLGGTVYLNSPTQHGDQITLRAVTSGSDSNYAYFRYTFPVSGNGTQMGLSADYLDYDLGKEYRALGSEGNAFEMRAFISQSYLRTRHNNFNWGIDIIQLKLDDHDENGELAKRTINSGVFRIYGDHDDDLFAAGTTHYSFDLTLGDLTINGNQTYIDFDKSNTNTAGSFNKFNYMISRLQHLSGPYSSLISLSGQYTDQNLDSSQKFYIGGPFSVPGYPTGEASGDNAISLHLDLRRDLYNQYWGGILQASIFYTYGKAELYHDLWTGWEGGNSIITQDITLTSMGFGLTQTWSEGYVLKLMLGRQTGENNGRDPNTGDDSDQSNKNYRAWLQGIYYF